MEPKAQETARLAAAELGVPWRSAPDLHEHDRRDVPFLEAPRFRQAVAHFFEEPDRLVFGRETANQALLRFTAAVDAAVGATPEGDLAVVTHGTVMSLYVAAATGIEPFPLWLRLGLPSFVVLSWPERRLLEIVDTIEPPPAN